jgi:polysaccharide biosynthesis/export protein
MEAPVTQRYIAPMNPVRWLISIACAALAFAGDVGLAAEPAATHPLVQIGSGDQVRVDVFGHPDLSTTTYVTDDGSIRMPLVGAVPVGDGSPVEVAKKIEAALKSGQFLIDPHVTVSVLQSLSKRVSVMGEVGKPGRYPVEPTSTVLDAIALAGGITGKGADVAFIFRDDASGVKQQIQVQTDMSQILASPDVRLAAMQPLQAGDTIIVPKATFTITGQVASQGEYRIEPGMLLYQAIARAGGLTPLGSASRVEIRRLGKDGKYVDMKGKTDTRIEPGDVIKVKERIF